MSSKIKCGYADIYKAKRVPKCGCEVCALKWANSSLNAQLESERLNAIAAEDDNHKLSAHLQLVIGAALMAEQTLRKVAQDHGFQTTDEGGQEVEFAIENIRKSVNMAGRHLRSMEDAQ